MMNLFPVAQMSLILLDVRERLAVARAWGVKRAHRRNSCIPPMAAPLFMIGAQSRDAREGDAPKQPPPTKKFPVY
jgi:hypothetical protein